MHRRPQTDRSEPELNDGPEVLGLLVHIMLLVAILSALGYSIWVW